jgi:hypothetical protein
VLAKTCRKPLRLAISAASATSSLQKFSVHDVIQRGTLRIVSEEQGDTKKRGLDRGPWHGAAELEGP